MLLMKGTSCAMNFTYGPALVYRGPKSIDRIYKLGEPVVVIADMIPLDEMRKIELTRVRGWVFEKGTATEDEDLFNFLMTEKRAAVISCEGATDHICDGDMVIVDGTEGYVCLSPNDETLAAFQKTRKLGPPTEKSAAVQSMARAILDGLVKEREEKERKGEKIVKSGEVMTVAEAKAASAAQPGLIYQLLSGLPLPNSPTAGEHGHQHPPAEYGGEGEHGHDHAGHDHDHAHEERKGRREEREEKKKLKTAEKVEAAPATAEAAAEKDSPADRKAQREAEIAAARAARRGEKVEEKPAEKAPEPAPAPAAPAPAATAPAPPPEKEPALASTAEDESFGFDT